MQTRRKIPAALIFSLLWIAWAGCISAGKLRQKCMLLYPATDSVTETVRYLQGRTDTVTQTVTIDCDSALQAISPVSVDGTGIRKPVIVTIPCPPAYHQVDTVERQVRIVKTNKAKEEQLMRDNNKMQVSLAIKEKQLRTCCWIIGLFALYTLLKLVARFYGRKFSWLAKLCKLFI